MLDNLWLKRPDAYGPGLLRAGPLWGRAVYTSLYSARLSSVPSRDLLPTLLVFQGAAVTHENFSQSPPGNVAVLRGSLPLQRFQEQLDWPSSAGPPLQGTEIAALSIPEAIHLSPIALLPGVLQRFCRTGKRSPFCPGQVCLDLISLLDGSL